MNVIGLAAAIIQANQSVSKAAIATRLRDALYADAANISIITNAIASIGRININTNGNTFRLTPTAIKIRIMMRPSDAHTVEIVSPARRTSNSNPIQNGNMSTVAIAISRSGESDR